MNELVKLHKCKLTETKSTFHIAFTNQLCSCGEKFNDWYGLMNHWDKYLPPDTKEKQIELFE